MTDLLYKAAYLIGQKSTWGSWARKGRSETIPGLGKVSVVEVKEDDRDRGGYYDEYPDGSTSEGMIVFRVDSEDGETAHFAKYGEYDSYGTESWHGKFLPVKPIEKTVYTYEKA